MNHHVIRVTARTQAQARRRARWEARSTGHVVESVERIARGVGDDWLVWVVLREIVA